MRQFLNTLLTKSWQGFKVAHHVELPARDGEYAMPAEGLIEPIQRVLTAAGIAGLYKHQATALDRIREQSTVVVATPTSSGKSMVYNIAVAEALLADPNQRALYIFPIKALTRDQLESLKTLLAALDCRQPLHTAIYDGDTTPYQRTKIRQAPPHVLLTNPDMLHYALLPYHGKWEAFWRHLRFVVVDEMHTYRGIFGGHVAQIFRRFQRICSHYGSHPQFVLLSATIANPQQLAGQLLGVDPDRVAVVHEHGAPQSKRHFVFFKGEDGGTAPLSTLAARILIQAAKTGLKTIAFTNSRKLTELLHLSVTRMAPQLTPHISSYRAGFLPEERRVIERNLANGSLAAVISTSALEMGIDIGGLDVCILVGYPGTVMNTWQRGGRVGRGGRESAIILLPQPDALDQYVVHHPQQFLQRSFEMAVTDPLNEEILRAHLPCAAFELPLRQEEVAAGPPSLTKVVDLLGREGFLIQSGAGDSWLARDLRPHRAVDIRSIGQSYAIVSVGKDGRKIPLGSSDGIRALKECHPGAIYLHRGGTYCVDQLDLVNRVILVKPSEMPYFTRVKSEKDTEILDLLAARPVGNFVTRLGRLRVTERIAGYEKRRLFTQELLGTTPLDLPEQVFETVGFWIEIESAVAKHIQAAKLHFMGGIHALEHAAISMFPWFALCDRNDLGGIAIPHHPQIGKSAVFIYDSYPGGIGLARQGFETIEALLHKTREMVSTCNCLDGCPSCIHSPKCGSGNKPLDKAAALAILNYLLGDWSLDRPLDPDAPATASPPPPEAIETPVVSVPATPPLHIGFFDLETQRLAQDVGGWHNKHLMRVSVAVLYDTARQDYRVYRENELDALIEDLQQLDLVVGFNLSRFDYEVLKAYTAVNLQHLPTLDMLHLLHTQLGFRLSLDHLASRNLGKAKKADGIQAVQWFREGQWDQLIEYCKEDVSITRELFERAIDKGYLVYEDKQGRLLRVPTRWDLKKWIKRH